MAECNYVSPPKSYPKNIQRFKKLIKVNLHYEFDFATKEDKNDMEAIITIFIRQKKLLSDLQSQVNSITSINAGTGKCVDFFCFKLFPSASVFHTDINPPDVQTNHFNVYKMSVSDAVEKIECDLILCLMPPLNSDGYHNLVANMKCKFCIFLGYLAEGKLCDPCYESYNAPRRSLIQQLMSEMKLVSVHTVNRRRYQHLAVFEKVNAEGDLKTHNRRCLYYSLPQSPLSSVRDNFFRELRDKKKFEGIPARRAIKTAPTTAERIAAATAAAAAAQKAATAAEIAATAAKTAATAAKIAITAAKTTAAAAAAAAAAITTATEDFGSSSD